MNEHLIRIAEKLGLSHKEPEIGRRRFLRGALAVGAVAAVPGVGLVLPERKVWQVKEQLERPEVFENLINSKTGEKLKLSDVEQGHPLNPFIRDVDLNALQGHNYNPGTPVYAGGKLAGWSKPLREEYDYHLANAARSMGISYQEAALRRHEPEVIRYRNASKQVHFATFAGASPESVVRMMRENGITIDREAVEEIRKRIRVERVGGLLTASINLYVQSDVAAELELVEPKPEQQ